MISSFYVIILVVIVSYCIVFVIFLSRRDSLIHYYPFSFRFLYFWSLQKIQLFSCAHFFFARFEYSYGIYNPLFHVFDRDLNELQSLDKICFLLLAGRLSILEQQYFIVIKRDFSQWNHYPVYFYFVSIGAFIVGYIPLFDMDIYH